MVTVLLRTKLLLFLIAGVSAALRWHPLAKLLRALPGCRALRQAREIYKYNASFPHNRRRPSGPLLVTTKFIVGLSPRILFYPERPPPNAVIHKICLLSGYPVSNNPAGRFELAIKWRDTTQSPRDSLLSSLAARHRVLNIDCEDISKARVSRTFAAVFGYTASVDPVVFLGRCVRKSSLNARHDGQIIVCPLRSREAGFEYQRVIDNEVGDGVVEDIRIPVFRSTIPFVYLKYRPVATRFSNINTRVVLAEVQEVLTQDEIGKILRVCSGMGVDYGELDILRDRSDHRIYVVDVNPTPWGPPKKLSESQTGIALARMASAFQEVFLRAEDQ